MLILARYPDEEIVINPGPDEIRIKVIETTDKRARLGITAPSDVAINRAELQVEIDQQPIHVTDGLIEDKSRCEVSYRIHKGKAIVMEVHSYPEYMSDDPPIVYGPRRFRDRVSTAWDLIEKKLPRWVYDHHGVHVQSVSPGA